MNIFSRIVENISNTYSNNALTATVICSAFLKTHRPMKIMLLPFRLSTTIFRVIGSLHLNRHAQQTVTNSFCAKSVTKCLKQGLFRKKATHQVSGYISPMQPALRKDLTKSTAHPAEHFLNLKQSTVLNTGNPVGLLMLKTHAPRKVNAIPNA